MLSSTVLQLPELASNTGGTVISEYSSRSATKRAAEDVLVCQRAVTQRREQGGENAFFMLKGTLAACTDGKIWMSSCNDCGSKLHVRRVRCTGCGAIQMSKDAFTAPQEEYTHTKENAEVPSATTTVEQHVGADAEKQEAASQRVLTVETSSGTNGADTAAASLETVVPAAESTCSVAAEGELKAASLPAASSDVVSSKPVSTALLTPAQLLTLRRMRLLRTLLRKLPPGVAAPTSSVSTSKTSATGTAAPVPCNGISMLASVACI